ncbi:zinc transporter foi isoform X2 [Orussus abietinus]|nr:zinc transporter foi isoform X2 [Orussus abietinus]XP_012274151.1 zinc transporter foi isoform X2 [Orussus abietinus]XP_012274152.1 zinc transporter foi isoform X2 [Orussus abietinus]
MSHHFMTVCMVCVLCAAHNPCSAHNIFSSLWPSFGSAKIQSANSVANLWSSSLGLSDSQSPVEARVARSVSSNIAAEKQDFLGQNAARRERRHLRREERHIELEPLPYYDADLSERLAAVEGHDEDSERYREIMERLGQPEVFNERSNSQRWEYNVGKARGRTRRDAEIDRRYFIRKVFEAYGDGNSMTLKGFEKLLRRLGLFRLSNAFDDRESQIRTDQQSGNRMGGIVESRSSNDLRNVDTTKSKQRCLSSRELLGSVLEDPSSISTVNNSTILPEWLFERVCPALIYQLAEEPSSDRAGCVLVPESYQPAMIRGYAPEEMSRNMFQVWVYSTISILIISLCGLLGVAVIPVMGKSYYNQLLQFLVALAIGTLCGDAFIHLLPHAMMSPSSERHGHEDGFMDAEEEEEEDHNLNMWKGLVAMMGLVMFFFTEKALTMIAEWRKQHQRRSKLPPRVRVMREPEGPNSNTVGEKLCKHKYSSYPYCYGEITTDAQDNHNCQHYHHQQPPSIEEEKPLTSNCNSVSNIVKNNHERKGSEDWKSDEPVSHTKKSPDGADIPLNEMDSYTVIIREHENKHHGHTHSHGHVHSAPDSMSSVAWMVVMGDGLHNFTDGMAIGAAFSANIAGGFSTAIAVFCHELPHELGDFAVLLKAGMTAKQAVFYNLLSSVLCFFGMVFGVLIGTAPSASSWMFAAAAGMFIYIALVDMIPELASNHSPEGGSQWHFVLQALGLVTGLGIMLIIALYEHDLKHIFSD